MEGLGGTASVIAVASVGLQLVESVKHMCEFWQSISDAPEYIRDITKNLHIISSIVARIANTALSERQDEDMKLVLETCATQIEILHSITRQLKEQLSSTSRAKRKWAAIKTVFRAENIKKLQDAIERTKTILVLANQQRLMMMIAAGFHEQKLARDARIHLVTGDGSLDSIVGAVVSDSSLRSCGQFDRIYERKSYETEDQYRRVQNNSTSGNRRIRTQIADSNTRISSIFGNLALRSRTFWAPSNVELSEEEDGQQTGESYLTIRPALWLARFGIKYGIRVARFQSHGSWKHVFNTFRPIPDDSLVFEFCKLGNLDGVRLLLDKREASTWDTNSKGQTLLHVAAGYCHPTLCKFLIDEGADKEARDDYDRSCFSATCLALHNRAQTSSDMIAVLRLFFHQADLSEPGSADWFPIICLAWHQHIERIEDSGYMAKFSSFTWLVNILKDCIRANIHGLAMFNMLWHLSYHWNNKDMKLALANFPSPTHMSGWIGWSPLYYCVWFQDYTLVRSLNQKSAMMHLTELAGIWSPVEESPTSISLYSSTAFLAWRQFLEDEQLPFEEFITQELEQGSLKSENWDEYSLIQIFSLNFEPAVYPDHSCERCHRSHRRFSLVEIPWQDVLQQFNPRKEIMDLLDDLRVMDVSSSVRSVENRVEKCPLDTLYDGTSESCSFEVEWVCVWCWHKMLGTPDAIGLDTDDEKSDQSDSDGDNTDCDDNDDQDSYETDSDDSPFLLSI